jgi:hypothetical protein
VALLANRRFLGYARNDKFYGEVHFHWVKFCIDPVIPAPEREIMRLPVVIEVKMAAYLLILFALLSRVAVSSHHGWLNFTAVGGSLLFFGARQSLRQMALPVIALAAMDYYMTVSVYNYPFHVQDYLLSWAWYAAVIVLGRLLLRDHRSVGSVAAGVVLASTSFFLASNFAAWSVLGIYPRSAGGLMTAYVAGLPFYRNDLLSTGLVAGLAFGLPALARHFSTHADQNIRGRQAA